jgi:hypothetical protein
MKVLVDLLFHANVADYGPFLSLEPLILLGVPGKPLARRRIRWTSFICSL